MTTVQCVANKDAQVVKAQPFALIAAAISSLIPAVVANVMVQFVEVFVLHVLLANFTTQKKLARRAVKR